MKSILFFSAFPLLFTSISAQEINPIRMGQFFEQGYGRATDDWEEEESALDIKQADSGLVMSGWIDEESKNMALWRIDDIGRMTQFGSYGHGGADQIGSAVALHSSGGVMMAGRQTSNYDDDQHSFIGFEDQALIKCIAPDGIELWSLLLDSSYGVTIDTHQVAVDVVNDGADNFLILVNRMYGEGPTLDCRVVSMQFDGTVNWDETYTLDDHNVFAQKLIKSTNGKYTILANDVEGEYPVLLRFDESSGDFVTSASYSQTYSTTAYGIDYKTYGQASSGYVLAGVQDNGSDQDGFLLEVANDLTGGTVKTIANTGDYPSGQEVFREIATHPNGYVAIGECDNRGEGQRDVWICHLDTARDTLKHETLGGEETDYAQGAVMIPSMQSLFIAGYNNSYTIEESGNAYLGGVKVDMPFGGEEECKVPRSLWVDDFTWNNGNGGIDLNNYILGNSSDENDLIDFAENHNITYLILYGLNFIFEPGYQSDPTTQQAKVALSNFINKCYLASPRISVGMVSTTKEVVWTNGIQYNIDIANNSSQYNYNRNGKISYFVLEHEFWRAHEINAFSGNTGFYIDVNGDPQNHQEDGIATNDVSTSLLNDHFTNVWNDHKTILTNLKSNKLFDANVNGLHDYITFLYYTYSGANSTNNNSSNGHQISRAQFIENKADAIFFTYYRKYFTSNNGQNFLTSYPYALDRLSFFGGQSKKTLILPLFSGEIWDSSNPDKQCGVGANTDFLGRFLEDAPGNGNGTFKDVEMTYQSQHQVVYNNTTAYPDIQNIKIANYSWFKYSCLDQKLFNDNGLIDCQSFNEVLKLHKLENNNVLLVFPNPSTGSFKIEAEGNKSITKVLVYNQVGQLLETIEPSSEYKLDVTKGIYFLIVESKGGEVSTHKLLVQ